MPGAARALREAASSVEELDDYVGLVERFDHAGIRINAWQIRSEILTLLRLLERDPPGTVLEIGTAQGGTLFLFTRVARPDALLISVDLPGGGFGGGYPAWRRRLYRSFARDMQEVHLVRGDSHSQSTLQEVSRLLAGRELDLLLIDGDHSYAGVKADFERYGPLVADGGLIAFHDIVPQRSGGHGDPGGVPTFWQELRSTAADVDEFVADWSWGSCGIGVVRRRGTVAG